VIIEPIEATDKQMTNPYLPNHILNRLPNKESHSSKKVAHLPSSLNTSLSPIASAVKASVAGLVGLSLEHGSAQAATIQVTSNSDDIANDTICTLREAITAINFPPTLPLSNGCFVTDTFGNNDTVTFSPNLPNNTIVLNQGELEIESDTKVTINASNITGGITVDANQNSRVLDIDGVDFNPNDPYFNTETTVFIDSLTIENGRNYDSGGGILVSGDTTQLTLTNSTVTDNQSGNYGGGIFTSGTVNLIDSTVSNNSGNIGAGIFVQVGETLNISNSTLSGNGTRTFSGATGDNGGAIYASNNSTITINDSVITSNFANLRGGAINANSGTVVNISNSRLSGNSTILDSPTSNSDGGAIHAFRSTITLSNTTLSDNISFDGGGAIYANNSTVEIVSSTLSNNSALGKGSTNDRDNGDGGAIYATMPDTSITLTNSTLSGNYASDLGGAVFARVSAQVTIQNSTFSDNESIFLGGALGLFSGVQANISNSIIANSTNNNNAGYSDCHFSGTNTATGVNTAVSTDDSTIIESGDCNANPVRAIDPGLESLADNGGPTQTHALQENSPARDTGILESCTDRDQRGELRDDGDGLCNVGAFENVSASPDFYVIPLGNGKSVVIPL